MRRERWIYTLVIALFVMAIVGLAGCGGKSEESVSKKIEKQLSQVTGYKAEAEMTMKTGREERTYDIQVWYEKGETDFYRVDLANETDDHRQTILKNQEGVFVLTPVLNKSFKFQADWPEKNGQPYLYQSLIQDIVADGDVTFSTHDDYYKYKTKTNYMNNKHLPHQYIFVNKKTYLPMYVQVLGEDETPLIEVKFKEINLNPTFSEADFNREAILSAHNEGDKETDETKETGALNAAGQQAELLLPVVTKGAELIETEEVDVDVGKRIIMTFKGERNFTLIQEHTVNEAVPVMAVDANEIPGELVHLGHSIGAISGDMVEWNYKGTQFYLASSELTRDELIDVASSVYGKGVK